MAKKKGTGQYGIIRVASVFAAIGGFARAFREAGASIAWATDRDKFAAETFQLNLPDVRYIQKPIEDVSVIIDELEPVDILTGGFPCQPFSIAGDKLGFKDDRGLLFTHIIRLIREFGKNKPKVLLLENVRNLKTHDKGRTFARIKAEIQKAGYWFTDDNAKIMNTAFYTEIPQNRERIFMIALSHEHFSSNAIRFPEPFPEGKMKRVQDYLDLAKKADAKYYFTAESQYLPLFQEAVESGDKHSVFQLRRSYVRENQTGMCFTLMANMGEGGHNQPVVKDRWGIRKLTPRECARLQGYKDEWLRFPASVSDSQRYKQIGNSITVPLVIRLAKNILAELAGRGE